MPFQFYKYHGTGNDFILIDNRNKAVNVSKKEIAALCHRRFGIGADGLMLLQEKAGFDFQMLYYNADGGETSMCGNGGRCIVQFAKDLGIIEDKAYFLAIDGTHRATIDNGKVALGMIPVKNYQQTSDACILDTGSPHYVTYRNSLKDFDVFREGAAVRNSPAYKAEGINVNFVEQIGANELFVRTFERGVEAETYSCGTGVVAASLADYLKHQDSPTMRKIKTLGGNLEVHFNYSDKEFDQIILKGPAQFVFKGEWPA